MFLTVHSAIGITAVTAAGIANPAGAFALGWLLHHLGDAVPHGDEGIGEWAWRGPKPAVRMGLAFVVDAVLLLVVCLAYAYVDGVSDVAVAAVAGSVFPDVLFGAEVTLDRRKFSWLTSVHVAAHKATGILLPLKVGLPAQAAVAAALWFVILN